MANQDQVDLLTRDIDAWNKWRRNNLNEKITLTDADLRGVKLSRANLSGADLRGANLSGLRLGGTILDFAILDRAILRKADLSGAHLSSTSLKGADLEGAIMAEAYLFRADFSDANLRDADLVRARLKQANLSGSNLSNANLVEATLAEANLTGANLTGSRLDWAYLSGANLSNALIINASLNEIQLIDATVEGLIISGSSVFGINVWGLKGEIQEQKDLIITRHNEAIITVDNIKVAQFIYLILDNKEIRNVINTLTSKTVLILGRFTPERKEVLDALRNELRKYNLLPILFDFDRPLDKDITETIKTLAGLCLFVIADITNPKSSPLELQAIIPDFQIPLVPIIQEGEQPFSMMADLQSKYGWALDTCSYDSVETLIKTLELGIIEPAMKKHAELRLAKAQVPNVIPLKRFL